METVSKQAEKVILLNIDIYNIYSQKNEYSVEELANLYSVRKGVIKYIHNLTEQEVHRSSGIVTEKHQYVYVDIEEDLPKPKKPKKSKPKKAKNPKKPAKSYYIKKDPSQYNYRKTSVSDEKIRRKIWGICKDYREEYERNGMIE